MNESNDPRPVVDDDLWSKSFAEIPDCYLAISYFPKRENPISIGVNGFMEMLPGVICMAMQATPAIRDIMVSAAILYCKENKIDLATLFNESPV